MVLTSFSYIATAPSDLAPLFDAGIAPSRSTPKFRGGEYINSHLRLSFPPSKWPIAILALDPHRPTADNAFACGTAPYTKFVRRTIEDKESTMPVQQGSLELLEHPVAKE